MVGGVGLWMWLVAGVAEARADSCRADGALVCTLVFESDQPIPGGDDLFRDLESSPAVVCLKNAGPLLQFNDALADDIVFCTHEAETTTQAVGKITVNDGGGHDLTLLDVEMNGRLDGPIISWTATGAPGETVSLRNVHGDDQVPQVAINANAGDIAEPVEVVLHNVLLEGTNALDGWVSPIVEVCGGTTRLTLEPGEDDVRAFGYGEETPRNQALIWKDDQCSFESTVVLSGVIEGDEVNAWAGVSEDSMGLVPDPRGADAAHALDVLEVDGLDVTNVVCDPCLGANEKVRIKDLDWVIPREGAEAGLLAKSNDAIALQDVLLRTTGRPWTLGKAHEVHVLRTSACAGQDAAVVGSSWFTLFDDGSDPSGEPGALHVWNSRLVSMGGITHRLAGSKVEAGAHVGLRGVTLATPRNDILLNDTAEAEQMTADVVNTLFVATGDVGTDTWFPEGTLAAGFMVTDPGTAFGGAELDCSEALDLQHSAGWRDAGVKELDSERTLHDLCADEIGEIFSECPEDADPSNWCDDGGGRTWPDIGAYSGPLSDPDLAPVDDDWSKHCDGSARPDDTGGGADSGGPSDGTGPDDDTADPALSWGGTCGCVSGGHRGVGAVLPLLLVLGLRRRD